MKFWIRVCVATLALLLTSIYWLAAFLFVTEVSGAISCRIVDYFPHSAAPRRSEIALHLLFSLALVSTVYGLGVFGWRRLDDWLKQGVSR